MEKKKRSRSGKLNASQRTKRKEIRCTNAFLQVLQLESLNRQKYGRPYWSESDILHLALADFIRNKSQDLLMTLPANLQESIRRNLFENHFSTY